MRPDRDFDPTRTAAHIPSMTGGHLLLSAGVADKHAIETWDDAYMRAPNDPNYRETVLQPPDFDGQYGAPGMIFVLRRAFNCAPDANASWEKFRNYWVKIWGWQQVNSEPSMFFKDTDRGIARMECSTDDFCMTGPDHATLERLCKPFKTLGSHCPKTNR
jgi:hypothetical protein